MFIGDSKKHLAVAVSLHAASIGLVAGLDHLNSLAPPRDSETLVVKKPDPQVGEVVTAHSISIRLHSVALGGATRMPIGTTSVYMTFTDEQGRDMTAVLKTVDRPAQPAPNVEDFEGYNVEGCKLRIESIGIGGLLKVTKLES